MSKRCQGCGGMLGLDCFNEYDCIQISRNNSQYSDEESYHRGYAEGLTKGMEDAIKILTEHEMNKMNPTPIIVGEEQLPF